MPVTPKTWAHLGRMAAELRDLSRAREARLVLPQAPEPVQESAAPMVIDYPTQPRE